MTSDSVLLFHGLVISNHRWRFRYNFFIHLVPLILQIGQKIMQNNAADDPLDGSFHLMKIANLRSNFPQTIKPAFKNPNSMFNPDTRLRQVVVEIHVLSF